MKMEVTLTEYYSVEIADDKLDAMLKDYRETISSTAEREDLFIQAAGGYQQGNRTFIEGIGNLKEKGVTVEYVDRDYGAVAP